MSSHRAKQANARRWSDDSWAYTEVPVGVGGGQLTVNRGLPRQPAARTVSAVGGPPIAHGKIR